MALSQVMDTGNGATLTFSSTTFAVALKKINGFEESVERLLTSSLATTTYNDYIPSDLKDPPEVVVDFYWDTGKDMPALGNTAETITITYPVRTNGGEASGATYAGTGFIKSIKYPDLENGAVQMGSMTLCFNGATGPAFTKAVAA